MNFNTKDKKISLHLDKPTRKKIKNQLLAQAHSINGRDNKSIRASNCGNYLKFEKFNEVRRLCWANFCKARLCPMCNWRLSLKRFANLSATINELHQQGKYQLLFLTLTQRNCIDSELKQQIKNILSAWRYLSDKNPIFGHSIKGWFRALEVTYNQDMDSYHPHLHIVLVVRSNYFTYNYITQANWVKMWQKALKADYVPIVDIRREYKNKNRNEESSLLSEASKYATKDSDYLIPGNIKLTAKVVEVLDSALRSVRLIAYGGKLKSIYEKLKLEEKSYNDDCINDSLVYVIERYRWSIGFKKYVLVEEENRINN